jgi:hypothetical protein
MMNPRLLPFLVILTSATVLAAETTEPAPAPATPAKEEAKAAAANPFATKFGGPYRGNEKVSPEFRKAMLEYVGPLRGAFGSLGAAAISDAKGSDEFFKEVVDPLLAKLQPRTEEEKNIREAALYLKRLNYFLSNPKSIPEEEQKSLQAFLDSCVLPEHPLIPKEEKSSDPLITKAHQYGNALILVSIYGMGMEIPEYLKFAEGRMEQEKEKTKAKGR